RDATVTGVQTCALPICRHHISQGLAMGELIVVREVLLVHGKFRLEGFPVIVQPLLNLPAPHLGVLRRKQDNACRRTGLASGKFEDRKSTRLNSSHGSIS